MNKIKTWSLNHINKANVTKKGIQKLEKKITFNHQIYIFSVYGSLSRE